MKFKEGTPKPANSGRKKGVENKITQEVKMNFQHLFDANIGKVQSWLDRTAEVDPDKALTLFLKLAEFVHPKAKQEIEITDKTITISLTE